MILKIKFLISALFLFGSYSYSTAQEIYIPGKLSSNMNKKEKSQYFVRVEGGEVDIIELEATGDFYAIRIVRSVARENRIRGDIGFMSGEAADGFKIIDAGLEWLIFPRALISPYIGGGAGVIKYEDVLFGLVYRWNAGISMKLGGSYIRFTMQKGTQVGGIPTFILGNEGPNYFSVGLDFGI